MSNAKLFCIYRGTFSVIRRCFDKLGDRVCAVKIVDLPKMSSSSGLTDEGRNYLEILSIMFAGKTT